MKKLLIDVWHAFKAKIKKWVNEGERQVKWKPCRVHVEKSFWKLGKREEGKWVNLINFTLAAQMGKDCVYVHTKVLFSNALIINSSTVNQKFTLFHVDRVRQHFKSSHNRVTNYNFCLNFSNVKWLKFAVLNIYFLIFRYF